MATYPCLEITMNYSLPGAEQAVNVFHVFEPGTLDLTTAAAWAGFFTEAWEDHLKARQSTQVSLDEIVVTDLRTEGGPQFVIPWGVHGTNSGDPLPNQVSALISWQTAVRLRRARGRTYLPGFTETGSDGNFMTDVTAAAVQAFGDQLVINLAGNLLVLSRQYGTTQEITNAQVRSNWKVQDRRRVNV